MKNIELSFALRISDDEDEEDDEKDDDAEPVAPVQEVKDHPGRIWDGAFVGDSEEELDTCSSNSTLRLWNLSKLSGGLEFRPARKPVVCLAVTHTRNCWMRIGMK